jgi:serine/threonine protein phosphatase PrpC
MISESGGVPRDCPGCGERVLAEDRFCEACGKSLRGPCTGCGGTAISDDGYCDTCGLLQPDDRDHVETTVPGGAAVSDRGLRRSRNEDAAAMAVAGPVVVAVVCDGVSSSPRPDKAARLAVEVAAGILTEQIASGADAETASGTAVAAAAKSVAGLATSARDAPACTYVSAAVDQERVTIGWVGDSRAYWVAHPPGRDLALPVDTPAGGHAALTTDDSWAHALTAWLGGDAGEIRPHIETFIPGGPGVVVVCSDGLWNHLPEPADLANAIPNDTPPLEAAHALVRIALDGGGQDNITVALIPFPPPSDSSTSTTRSAVSFQPPDGGPPPATRQAGADE